MFNKLHLHWHRHSVVAAVLLCGLLACGVSSAGRQGVGAQIAIGHAPVRTPAGWRPTPEPFTRGRSKRPYVALTFDGDWFATGAEAIVGTLARHHARATFFLTGHFCHTFPAVCRALSAAGMELGNHSERHPDFTRQSDARIRTELERGEEALVQTFGHGARPLFRFPYSACDARSEALVARAGFQSIDCSLDVLDTVGRPKTSDFIAHRVMNQVRAGDVVLLHFTAGTAGALPRICNYLDHAGLQLVPVSTLLFSGARPTR